MSNTKKKLPTGPIRMEIPTSKPSETREVETITPESGLLENTKQDSGKQDYKKVAMRLSADSLERLRKLRVETGLPYEILVDVMIRNWDKLPQRTQSAYLKEAKAIRGERLIAGQIKSLQAIKSR